ncbi:hypothetical protein ACIPRU_01380 [Streptomyces sp. NPDC090126]|uniref:hypothetical protein n=1 Tax=Streptomyces sp. NPDC090126 TaxID=3365952 RepID=UPI003811BC18
MLGEFVFCAQAAERAAYRRPDPWGEDEEGRMTQTGPVMTALWTASDNVTLLCDEALREPVRTYGQALNRALPPRASGRKGGTGPWTGGRMRSGGIERQGWEDSSVGEAPVAPHRAHARVAALDPLHQRWQ